MEINFIEVLVAAFAAFIVGWLWHGPVFGKKWMALEGMTPERMAAMTMKPGMAMGLGFVSMYITAAVISWFAALLGTADVMGALGLAFAVWLGFTMTTLAGKWLWEGRSFGLFAFNAIYSFVSLFVMAYVIALWN